MISLTLTGLLLKCAVVDKVEAKSPNGQIRVVADLARNEVRVTGFSTKTIIKSWASRGHHPHLYVHNDGRILIVDTYEGAKYIDLRIDSLGQYINAESALGERDKKDRPHKWTCHPEGEWLKRGVEPVWTSTSVLLTMYNGRTVKFSK